MRNPRDDQRVLRRYKFWYRFFRVITILIILGTALAGGLVVGLFTSAAKMLPSGEDLADIRPSVPSRVLASDGSLLAKIYLPDQNREIVPISRMGNMVIATRAIEDIRFFTHPGIDLRGIARAAVANLKSGDAREGASTITQQLARNLYLSREKKLTRKLQEIILALELERRYSKDEILETYLNQVYYGSNSKGLQSWGVQMASQNYFGKNVDDLTLSEASLLAGLPKNPRDYNPYKHPKAARDRRNLVLSIMRDNNYISEAQYKKATTDPIKLAPEKVLEISATYHAPYFVLYILNKELEKIFGQDAGTLLYHYGIDIYTSLDPRMQKVAEETVKDSVEKNKFRKIDDGALISIDPQTGLIKAMVGGTDFQRDQFNVITQGKRQPGSSFKPFDYTTAMIHGYTPDTIVFDRARPYPSGSGKPWIPKNSDGRYRGAMPLKKALWLSRNAAAAGVAYDVGIKEIIKIAHRMGIKYELDPFLPTALGASVVYPLEICSAYGTLANRGIHIPPAAITRVTTTGGEKVLYEYYPEAQRVIPSQIADTMKITMRGVIERGTARAARCPFPASGKTGTTNSYKDAWFIGYTDDLVTAVWVGNRHNEPMNHTFGGTVPAPIWREYMLVAQPIIALEHRGSHAELERLNALPEPNDLDTSLTPYVAKVNGRMHRSDSSDEDDNSDNEATAKPATPAPKPVRPQDRYLVTICTQTNLRATRWCPETKIVTYIKGRPPFPPKDTCHTHTGPESIPDADGSDTRSHVENGKDKGGVIISICAQTGKIATAKCPIVLQRRFTHDPPTETCPLHGGE